MPFVVPISAYPLLQDPPFVLGLTWLATAIGSRVLRTVHATFGESTPLERGLLSAALGFGLLQYLAFGLGVSGLLTSRNLWIGLILLLVVFAADMLRVAQGIGKAIRAPRTSLPNWIRIGTMVLAIPLLFALFQSLCPPTDIDGTYYHLTAPKRWLQMGAMGYLPTLLHTNTPMSVDMLFTLALGTWSDTAAKLIHYTLGILSLLAIFALGKRVKSETVGFLTVVLFLVGLPSAKTVMLFTWAYVDLGITFQIISAMLAWLLWNRSRSSGWLIASALCAGFATTTKMTVAFAGLALSVLTFLTLHQEEKNGKSLALRSGLGFLALSLLPVLPWMARAWTITGNPVYPVLASLFPTRDWSPEAGKAFERFFRYYVWGTSSGGGWSLAKRQLLLFSTMGGVILGATFWMSRARDKEIRALVGVATMLALISLWSTGLYLRYFLPLLPLVYIALLSKQENKLSSAKWVQVVTLLVALFLAVSQVKSVKARQAISVALGRTSRADFLAREYPPLELWNYANQKLPAESHIFLVAGRPSYYIEPYCYVSEAIYQHCIRMDTWENYLADLERNHITHIIVPASLEPYSLGMEFAPAANERPFAGKLITKYGYLLFQAGPDSLYALNEIGGQKPPE